MPGTWSQDTQKPPPGVPRPQRMWLEFVGEGAANTIWALHFDDAEISLNGTNAAAHNNNDNDDDYTKELRCLTRGFLLRIQKDLSKGSDSGAFTARDQLAYFTADIQPHFGPQSRDLFVEQKPVNISQEIIDECNAILSRMDANHSSQEDCNQNQERPQLPHPYLPIRTRKFVGSYVGPKGWHMLTEDMRARNPREHFAEIKPKWLTQSPTAPEGAELCRNCAIAAKRFTDAPEGKKPSKSDPARFGCPLYLVASEPDSALNPNGVAEPGHGSSSTERNGRDGAETEQQEEHSWKPIAERIFPHDQTPHSHFLFRSIRRHHLLRHLSTLQSRLAGPNFFTSTPEDPDLNLLITMTLRDCSLFIRYEEEEEEEHSSSPKNGEGSEEADKEKNGDPKLRMLDFKLADLDKKTPSKIPSWQETERDLIEGGWYHGRGREHGHEDIVTVPRCYLRELKQKGKGRDAGPVPTTAADLSKLKDRSLLGKYAV